MREFQEGQRFRVRDEGGDPTSQPDKRWLGKDGILLRWVQEDMGSGRPLSFWVEFDNGEVDAISPDWLEQR